MAHRRRWLIGVASVVALAVALVLIVVGQPSLAEDGVIYVDAEAPGPIYNGESWDTAFTNLQAALDVVGSGQQIWVATGVYTPTSLLDAADARSATFQMSNEVAIYGGFAGTETERGQRDWSANPTILSGDLNGDDGSDFANRADNSYHVFYHPEIAGLDSTAVLDGFTISGGYADGAWPHDEGGGMFNDLSSPTLTNCIFADNWASEGGGMYNWESSPELTNCTFTGNGAGWNGGGMYNMEGNPTLTNCLFASNSAGYDGGGMENYPSSSPTLVNCTFRDNSAGRNGGGMDNCFSSSPTLTNCTFSGNSAGSGGGISNSSSSPTLTNCILWGDTAGELPYEIYGDAAIATYSDIQGDLYPGTGNINEDPLFVDADNGDLHLGPSSPCIDTGDNAALHLPAHDFEGDARMIDGDGDGTATVDMGVDEAWSHVYLPLVLMGY